MTYFICYDVSEDKIRKRVAKYLESVGYRLTEKAFPLWCAFYEDYMEKPVKAYGGETPRAMIRKEVRQFSETVFRGTEPAQT